MIYKPPLPRARAGWSERILAHSAPRMRGGPISAASTALCPARAGVVRWSDPALNTLISVSLCPARGGSPLIQGIPQISAPRVRGWSELRRRGPCNPVLLPRARGGCSVATVEATSASRVRVDRLSGRPGCLVYHRGVGPAPAGVVRHDRRT